MCYPLKISQGFNVLIILKKLYQILQLNFFKLYLLNNL